MPRAGTPPRDDDAFLSIGAVSRATGIPAETLRTWESRYGFPTPTRKPSGQRVYRSSCVPRLRRISDALARGHRAAEVLTADDVQLAVLLGGTEAPPTDSPADDAAASRARLSFLLDSVRRLDARALIDTLREDWSRLGPLTFLEHRVAPLVEAVGKGWEKGTLDVRHEHFAAERLGDLLRTLRMPFDERATGPAVVGATLPGEDHGLGLQMASLVLATAGARVRLAGTNLPVDETAALAREVRATAVAISVSTNGRRTAPSLLRALRDHLPRGTTLLVGGKGAPPTLSGAEILTSLNALDDRARRLA
jgi:MerR family transcriptional regulator, light-induced transcriptional regulator